MDDANDDISEYERLRLKKIEENRKCLLELGLALNATTPKSQRKEQKVNSTQKSAKKRRQSTATPEPTRRIVTRRSVQLGEQYQHEHIEADEDEEAPPSKKKEYRENFFGAVPGTKVGDCWEYRLDCSMVGVHRPTVAGIHGGPDGAYSIALSGGYEDDIDYGDHFTYTGAGGRDLKGTKANPKNLRTAPQSKDQTPDGPNASLIASVKTRNPVRVIRGYKLHSLYAPESGYRYDGLYTVDKYWTETGLAGFLVYKFRLSRMEGQDPPVWELETNQENSKQRINCQKTPNKLDHSSPECKNSDLKIKTPKKSPSVNYRVSNPTLNQNNRSLNGFSPSKSPYQVSPAMTPEKKAKSPTKVSFESRNGGTPSKIPTSPSKVASKVSTMPSKLSTSPSKTSNSPSKISVSSSKVSTSQSKISTSPSKVSTSPSKVSTSPSKLSTSPLKVIPQSKVATSPLKVISQSKVATSPSKITSPSKVVNYLTKVSPNKFLLVKKVSVSPSKSSQSIPASGKTPPEKKMVFVSVKSPSGISLNNGNTNINRLFGTVNVSKTSSKKSSLSNGFSDSSQSLNNDAKTVRSPGKILGKTIEQSKNEVTNKSISSNAQSSNKVGSPKITLPLNGSSPSKVSSPTKSSSQKETEPFQSESSKKASQEKKEAKIQANRIAKDKISFKRDLFNGSSSSVPSSPKLANQTSSKRVARSSLSSIVSLENSSNIKRTRSNDLSSDSSSKTSESPKKLKRLAAKPSPQTARKADNSFTSSKSPPTSDRKKAKPSNTLERYFVKKFASNDYSRLNRYKVSPTKYNNDSDDESTPAFIGFNEITINNSRNRLKLLSDFFPSIMRKQTVKTKLNFFKKSKKADELTKCSSSKREFITSIDKIRDLSFKISNMSNFDPNAGFIPECFVKCSKIDSSEATSSDEEKQSENVFFFGETSCSSPNPCVPKKGLSPQKLLDLVSSDEENDDEPFLGFRDVSTRSIVRNGFLIQKYAKIFNKN